MPIEPIDEAMERDLAYKRGGFNATPEQLLCPHLRFSCECEVDRLEDTGRFALSVRCYCDDCKQPFHFKGLPSGLDMDGATVDVTGLELRIGIGPGAAGVLQHQE